MAIFTVQDRDAVKQALVTAAINGFASVSIAGQTTSMKSLDELRKILEMIQADLAGQKPHLGVKFIQLVPPGGGGR